MKTIYKSLIAAVALAPLASCVEEVLPTDGVTQEQLTSSSKSSEGLIWGIAAFMNNYATLGSDYAYDWGYGSIIHIRDVMTEDYAVVSSSYDWYTSWEQCRNCGPNMASTQFIWNYYNQAVLTSNLAIGTFDEDTEDETEQGYLAVAYTYRAMFYLDMARMYEYLDSDVADLNAQAAANGVVGLTVPIVTEKTTEEQARNNPRATREEMFEFILSDLQKAESLINNYSRTDKAQPDLSVVYGLMARLYLWVEDYPNALEYANQAISHSDCSVTTEEEWLSTTNGFNDLASNSWMWGAKAMKENSVVQTGILNWTSWASNETWYGYAAAGPQSMINVETYERMSDSDFRKLSYKAPEGSELYGEEPMIVSVQKEDGREYYLSDQIVDYASLKFRPGSGNAEDYTVGSATAFPLMRIEEMYFIQAEATAHNAPSAGAQLLTQFMQTYRNPSYVCRASGEEAVIEEIIFQKRVEFWGEGINFFDLKRLGYSVTRNYDGTNFPSLAAINTTGRPAWTNLCIVQTEGNNNKGVEGKNNPDPSGVYVTADEE